VDATNKHQAATSNKPALLNHRTSVKEIRHVIERGKVIKMLRTGCADRRTTSWINAAALALLMMMLPVTGAAHEYWLEPEIWQADVKQVIGIGVRNGEEFVGTPLPWDDSRFVEIEAVDASGNRPINGRLGDYPAISIAARTPGLLLVRLDTGQRVIEYADVIQFSRFLEGHALGEKLARHRDRNLPLSEIRERYYRYAKTLVTVKEGGDTAEPGTANPATKPVGQRLEIVLGNDPKKASILPVSVFFDGDKLPLRQIELFHAVLDGTVKRTTAVTDAQGDVNIELSGAGQYLVNVVHLTEPPDDDVHWVSHWASFTFER
jgi:uncharacterized GH25 family protein